MEEEKTKYQRSIAKLCKINELLTGKYIKTEGWDPSYIITDYGKIKRANLMGIMVSKENGSCIVDDGTGKIIVRDFNKSINADVGELIIVIGKPRQFGQEVFLNNEIIKKIENKKWVEFRKKQLLSRVKEKIEIPSDYLDDTKNSKSEIVIKEEEIFETPKTPSKQISLNENKNTGKAEKLIELIETLDKGPGANIEDVISTSEIEDAETIIKSLTEEGEIFQVKPGKLKVM